VRLRAALAGLRADNSAPKKRPAGRMVA